MSTTVTYKGNTLTTVNNNTKTLKTAGKYMEDDVILIDTASNEDVVIKFDGAIRFLDYDGTVITTYDSVPATLPAVPSHEGLTNGTWNYTYTQLEEQFEELGACDVGANYDTSDEKTHLHIHLEEGRTTPYLGIAPNGTVIIDWGDGSSTNTVTGTSFTSLVFTQHSYAAAGDYIITLEVESGEFAFYNNNSFSNILRKEILSSSFSENTVYLNALQEVNIGKNVKINKSAFQLCRNLTKVSCPSNVQTIGEYAFAATSLNGFVLTNNIENISQSAFSGCFSLINLSFSNNVKIIDTNAFSGCSNLTKVVLSKNVSHIYEGSFGYCTSLRTVVLPKRVTLLEKNAFFETNLEKIDIPNTTSETIQQYVFSNCYSLKKVTIPDDTLAINTQAFSGCKSLKEINIPNKIKNIGSNAFYGCFNIKEIILPDSVVTLGSSAFYNGLSLIKVKLSNNLKALANEVFANCASLSQIIIPENITSIGASAFSGCSGLAEIHLRSTIPPTLVQINAFSGISSDCKIYVPYSSDHSILDAYTASTNWATYADYMIEEEE